MTGFRMTARVIACRRYLLAMACNFAFICLTSVFAQENHYEKIFTTENGLPHNQVLSITTDKTGFLWIGTWDGLSRFDGYEFHNYFHDPDDSLSIPYFIARKICVDRHNNIWISHIGNILSRYRRPTDDFQNYDIQTTPGLNQTGIYDIITDESGNLIVTGEGGICLFDSVSFIFVPLVDEDKKPLKEKTIASSFDNEGNIWITTFKEYLKGRIFYGDNKPMIIISERYPILENDFFPRPNSYQWSYRIGYLPDSSLILFSNSGLRKLRSGNHIHSLPADFNPGRDYYWFSLNNKIYIVTSDDVITIDLKPGETVQALFLDNNEMVWYCTQFMSGMGTGLHRYTRTPGYFKHYLSEIDGKPTVVYSISKDDKGNLLVGSEATGFISSISENGRLTRMNQLSKGAAKRTTHVRSMAPVENGIFIGYMKEQLDFYDFRTRKFTMLCKTNDPTYLKAPFGFRSLFTDNDGNLLVGSMGLFKYTPDKEPPFEEIWHSDPPGKAIYSIKADSSGNIWAGTNRYLLKITSDFRLDTLFEISSTEYNIEDIAFDNNGFIWLALLGGGLEQFNPGTGEKEFYTTADGLSNNTTYSILKDGHNNLWITTDNGISRFNTKTRKFRIFGPTDGLQIHEFNSDAAFLDTDGKMYFGGMGGVVGFHPDSIIDHETGLSMRPLVITDFRVSGLPRYFGKAVYELAQVELNKGDDNFGITFASLDLKNPEKIKYRYRILGYNDVWTEADYLHRQLNITGLRPDVYTVEVQSTDIFGDWKNNLTVQIKIPPHFYQTAAFSTLFVLFSLAVLVLLVIINNRQIHLKENQKQQYLKLESIRGQMNPHFIFNSLNSINYFIANHDSLAANRYISNFSKLIRSFLSNMSQEYIGLADEIDSLEDYLKLEFLRFGDKFNYTLSFDQIESPENWEVFPGMVQPFVENAIWHGVRGLQDRKGLISVVFYENNGIHCMITDDGIGRQLSAQSSNYNDKKKSRGIGLIIERMQLINHIENKSYKIIIDDLYCDREECGTKIQIEIPSRMKRKT